MEVLGAEKVPVHPLHDPVKHVAGPVASRMAVGGGVAPTVFPQFPDGAGNGCRQVRPRRAPFHQPSDPLAEGGLLAAR